MEGSRPPLCADRGQHYPTGSDKAELFDMSINMPFTGKIRKYLFADKEEKNITLDELIEKWPRNILPLVDFDRKIGLIWTARSACSLSVLWYYAITGQIEDAVNFNPWPHKFRQKKLNQIIIEKAKSSPLKTQDITWVRVMRDPFKRAISSYRHFVKHLIEEEKVDALFGIKTRELGLSFEEFLQYLSTTQIQMCDLHFRQQWCDAEEFCQKVKIINADRSDLKKSLLGQMVPDQKNLNIFEEREIYINKIHVSKISNIQNLNSKTKITKQQIADGWPEEKAFDNKYTRALVRKIYAEDYSRFKEYI